MFWVLSFAALVAGYNVQANLTSEEIFQVKIQKDAVDPKGRTIDQIIKDAGTEEATKKEAAKNQKLSVQYDMLMDPVQYAVYYGNMTNFAGAAIAAERYRWPKRIIPYHIMDAFDERQIGIIYGAMKEWQEKTCIRFEPAGPETASRVGHDNYIIIQDGGGCSSYVGYNRWNHWVTLARWGCMYHTTVLHELGHTIGLNHEQCRPDRDSHLKVLFDNVREQNAFNFNIEYASNTFEIPYDYCSVMQYSNKAFSKSYKFTMLAKDFDYQYSLGRNKELQFSDAKVVNLMYKCNSHCPANPSCGSPCYVNHKCECECEREEAKCEKRPCDLYEDKKTCDYYRKILGITQPSTTPQPTTTPANGAGSKCVDSYGGCKFEAKDGNCEADWRVMEACPKSCGLCSPCGDKDPGCEFYANRGDCETAKLWMYENCNKSCQLC